jgi:murein L,D-transpeptidase YcbB/YkuD
MGNLKSIVVSFALFNSYLFANTITTNEVENKEKSFIEKNFKILNKSFLEKDYQAFLINKNILKDYYKHNNYQPFWMDKNGIKEISLSFLDKIKNDPVLGHKATRIFKLDEVLTKIDVFDITKMDNQKDLLTIDYMITELYDKYFTYLLKGSINWKAFEDRLKFIDKTQDIKAFWDRVYFSKDSKVLLKKSIAQNDLSIAFKEVDFNYPHTDKLILAINDLQAISSNGGYTKIPEIKSLRIGDNSEVVKFLRQRLLQSKDLAKTCENTIDVQNVITNSTNIEKQENISEQIAENTDNKIVEEPIISCETNFDEDLKTAVISFQKKHGLYADGIVGSQTQKFLNMSADEKIEKIRLNLERMRWLPRNLGEKYLVVNIPEFKLKMIENNDVKLNMAVVVGERKHPTPIFSDKMSYIVVNPKWNIPQSITKKEIIPKLIKDPNYLASKGIDIYDSWHPESEKMNAQEIIDAFILEDVDSMPNFRLTQSPSSDNPLGRMKFMFPNKHAVYLHDTPAKSLFANARRAYSHGCIRLAKPEELMASIASEDKNLNMDKVNSLLKESEEKSIGLNKKIPIHIVYLTSWVDENDVLQFREDIYNYDNIQKELLY